MTAAAREVAHGTTRPTDRAAAPCRLRPFRPDDADALARHANDREVWRHLRDAFPHPYALAHAEAHVARAAAPPAPGGALSLGIAVDDTVVGGIGLKLGTDVERVGAELGYWLGRAHWGRGIATAAVRGMTTHAFAALGLARVFALPFAPNAASCRVLEKAGFVREGTLRHSAIKEGVLLDQQLYAAYADRWPDDDAAPRAPVEAA